MGLLTHDVTHCKVWENWWKRPRGEETRAQVCQAVVLTEWEDAEWECEERGGGGRGRRWPRRWGCRLLATAREVVELFAPPDGIEVFHHFERERER